MTNDHLKWEYAVSVLTAMRQAFGRYFITATTPIGARVHISPTLISKYGIEANDVGVMAKACADHLRINQNRSRVITTTVLILKTKGQVPTPVLVPLVSLQAEDPRDNSYDFFFMCNDDVKDAATAPEFVGFINKYPEAEQKWINGELQ